MNLPAPAALEPVRLAHGALEADITPGYGANLVSFKVNGRQLIHFDRAACLAGEKITGAFNMFPTPCRLQDCAYTFEGRRFVQTKNGEPVFIHGLVRDEPFSCTAAPDRVVSQIEIAPGAPAFEGFPFRCLFEVSHTLDADSLTVAFRLVNRDTRRIPFGYGIHPYWKLHGPREETRLRIPCEHVLESRDLVPTGGVRPVAGTPLDFRTLKPLGNLEPDHVFWKREAGADAELRPAGLDRTIVITASPEFPHLIVYAPLDAPFICVENLTTAPNGQNLAERGDNTVANRLVAEPGATVGGWIRYTVQPAG